VRKATLMKAALVGVVTLVGASCGGGGNAPSSAADKCKADQFGCVKVAPGQPIHFGAIQSISQNTADLGNDTVHGVQLGMDYLDNNYDGKAGKLLGHDVKLTTEDETDPSSGVCGKAGGQSGATKLAADPTVVGVVGTTCSSAAQGVADKILSQKGILLISASNTAATLTAPGIHQPFYARTAQNDAIQGRVVADFIYKKLGLKRLATIHDESPYASGLTFVVAAFFKKLGGTVTAEEGSSSADKDFKPLLTSIAQGKPEIIYFPDFNPECALLSIQAKQIPGLKDVKLMGSDGCNDATFIKTAKTAANGVFLSSPNVSSFTSAAYNSFLAAYKKQFGEPTASFNGHAFDAFNLIANAIKKVTVRQSDGTLLIPRTALKDALFATKNFQGLTANLNCQTSGDCAAPSAVNIAVYQAPDTPYGPLGSKAKPIFSESVTLAQALTDLASATQA
jgi:branched-chain amino acid transport system substrate-binding protein